jgi:hypothetical protein
LEAGEVLLRQIDHGLRQQRGHELLGDVKRQGTLVIGYLRTRNCRLILRRLKPVLAFLPALDRVADAQVELGLGVEIGQRELRRVKEWDELGVPGESRIRPQVRSNFLGLVLKNGGTGRFERMIVFERELYGLIQRDSNGWGASRGRLLCERGADREKKQDPLRRLRAGSYVRKIIETEYFTVVALQSLISYKNAPTKDKYPSCKRKKADKRVGGD